MMKKITVFMMMALSIWVFVRAVSGPLPGITVCDVGQGDGEVMITDNGKMILNDCGPDDSILRCLSDKSGYWRKDIDVLIISHPHSDHFWGCFPVLEHYDVHDIFISDAPFDDKSYEEFVALAISQGINVHRPDPEEAIRFSQDCKLVFLKADYQGDNLNDFSLGVRLDCSGVSFLSLGDIESDKEDGVGTELSSDIFKVSHHGSGSSNSAGLLEKINPSIGVVSVGEANPYGHPSQDTIDRISGIGAKIWRTDRDGDFNFYFNIR